MDGCKGALDFFGRFAEDAGASDIRFIAIDFATAVDEDDIAFFQLLRLARAMRESGGSAEENERVAAQIHFGVTGVDELSDVFFGHSFL